MLVAIREEEVKQLLAELYVRLYDQNGLVLDHFHIISALERRLRHDLCALEQSSPGRLLEIQVVLELPLRDLRVFRGIGTCRCARRSACACAAWSPPALEDWLQRCG
jgi:hypothetical protein